MLIATSARFAIKSDSVRQRTHDRHLWSGNTGVKVVLIKDDKTNRVVGAYDPTGVFHYPVRRLSFYVDRDSADSYRAFKKFRGSINSLIIHGTERVMLLLPGR